MTWNAGGDFAEVVDTLETVTIRRAGFDEAMTTEAWRFTETVDAVDGADGAVTLSETVWQLPTPTGPLEPSVGDLLIDGSARCATLVALTPLRGSTRVRATCRRVTIRPFDIEWFDLEHPIGDPSEPTGSPVGWRCAIAALRGYDFRVATEPDPSDAAGDIETRRIVLTEPATAAANDRFVGRSGRVLRVVSQSLADRLGEGWSYDVVVE